MRFLNLLLLVLGCLIFSISFGQKDKFNYRRKLVGNEGAGWYMIKFPNEIYAHLDTTFSDVRLYDLSQGDTAEISYIVRALENDISEEIIDLPVLNRSKKNGLLYFTFEIKSDKKVNYLDLNFKQANYNAFVKIEGSHNQHEWFEIANKKRILSIQSEFVNYQHGAINYPESNYKFLRISIQSDVALNLVKASFRNQTITPGLYLNMPLKWIAHLDKKARQTIIDITLSNYVPVTHVNVDIKTTDIYYRNITIESVDDSVKTQKGWMKLYRTLSSSYLTSINPNNFKLVKHFTKQLRLIIHNQDNQPLNIKNIEVVGPQIELVAKLKSPHTFLYYGNKMIQNPSYELIHFKENIPDSTKEVLLQNEESLIVSEETANPLVSNKMYLWAIIGFAIIILGFFTLRMLKENS